MPYAYCFFPCNGENGLSTQQENKRLGAVQVSNLGPPWIAAIHWCQPSTRCRTHAKCVRPVLVQITSPSVWRWHSPDSALTGWTRCSRRCGRWRRRQRLCGSWRICSSSRRPGINSHCFHYFMVQQWSPVVGDGVRHPYYRFIFWGNRLIRQ